MQQSFWKSTKTAAQRLEARTRRGLLVCTALAVPGTVLPEGAGDALLEAVTSCGAEHIAGLAAASNALTLIP